MTTAYWCVLIAAYLPIAWTGMAKFGAGGKDFDNAAPRAMLAKLDGWRQRANWAQLNGFEAFPPFAAAVIIAHLLAVPQARQEREREASPAPPAWSGSRQGSPTPPR